MGELHAKVKRDGGVAVEGGEESIRWWLMRKAQTADTRRCPDNGNNVSHDFGS